MNEIELILLLLVVVAALTPIARRLHVPYPVLLVVGGLALALVLNVPNIALTPDLVFLLFLPPLVYRAAFTTSIRDFRALFRPILSLAVGLVLATMTVVAMVLHAVMPELGWPLAFAFGAIVSPPDAVAAAAVFRGLGVPRKVVSLLEGESLINDATALVSYGAALGASYIAVSAGEVSMRFAYVGLGGVAVGLLVAVIVAWLQRRLTDPAVEVTLSLLTPFAAYLPAEQVGVSGVLAAVTAGLYLGWRSPYISHSEARLRGRAVWDMVDFILNGLVFILIGLQLASIIPSIEGNSLLSLVGLGLLISLTLVLVRMVWVFGETLLQKWYWRLPFPNSKRKHGTMLGAVHSWKELFVVGWAGMRGVVSLAAALALPVATPERDNLIFLTFFVILATLVGQGLSLPLLIRALGVGVDSNIVVHQEQHARRSAAEAALVRIERLKDEWPTHLPLIDSLQSQYEHRLSHYSHTHNGADGDELSEDDEDLAEYDQEMLEHHQIRRAVIDAERAIMLDLRERGEIDDSVWNRMERDLDLEDLRMDA
jgi:CPA1 family monovalent cation:H+ antiporter